MKTDRTTKTVLGIIVCLGLWSPQEGLALQEGRSSCNVLLSRDVCRVQAEAGDAETQLTMGVAYTHGVGVPEDDTEAIRWFRMAAEQGDARAQYSLGLMYVRGAGVAQNDARAYLWLNIATAGSQGIDRTLRVTNRDRVAVRLSSADRAAAQRLATQCQASDFQYCGEPE